MARIIDAFTQFLDDSGDPLVDGFLKFNETGTTSTDKKTFADINEQIPNANPVPLDGAGRAPNIFGTGSYSVISFKDSIITPGTPGEQVQQFDPVGGTLEGTAFADWNAATIYSIGDKVHGSDGRDYESITNSNQNNNPTSSPTNWKQLVLGQIWNANVTYGVGDTVYGSDGFLYRSEVASNLNNDPTTSNVEWSGGSKTLARAYTDSGVANAYVLTVVSPGLAPSSYTDLLCATAAISNANAAGASTINIAGLGVKSLTTQTGTNPAPGEIDQLTDFTYDLGNDRVEIVSRKVTTQEFTSSGTYTRPVDVKTITVEVQGSGAGGGASGTTANRGGGGGSAGGWAKETLASGIVGASATVTVGLGGIGGVGVAGANGNASSFGAFVSASGGIGGNLGSSSLAGNPGGIGAGGDENEQGGSGAPSFGGIANGATGGASKYGGGGVGGVANRVGTDGVASGSGGGGGSTNDTNSLDGGAGANGKVVITEYR